MTTLIFGDKEIKSKEGETVLDAFIRQGITVPFSCRNGTCLTCILKAGEGSIPKVSQKGIKPYLRELGYFLPCKCIPVDNMIIDLPDKTEILQSALVIKKEYFTDDICRILLEANTSINYLAGQFINILHPNGTPRSYSLASLPNIDYFLELHVNRMPGGLVSNWILDELNEGDLIDFQGPHGECYLQAENGDQNLLLIATGTGVSPLIGIARDALYNGHAGNIFLYHGAKTKDNLYVNDQLLELENKFKNFYYTGCLSQEIDNPDTSPGRVDVAAFENHVDLEGWGVYICGHKDMVENSRKLAEDHGASSNDIHSDAFRYRDKRRAERVINKNSENAMEFVEEKSEYPEPDQELWRELDNGKLLLSILQEFYSLAYEDERLSPFFHGVTLQRAVEKQYSFLDQVFTGKKVYFGDRPRNAHHWMVISDDLFDYRENMLEGCIRRHGLSEKYIKRWMAIDEWYRKQIVKTRPWPKIVNGIRYPLDGLEEIEISVGSICDGCKNEVQPGEKVNYHVRLGTIFCQQCQGREIKSA